jgi:hypothetical protein
MRRSARWRFIFSVAEKPNDRGVCGNAFSSLLSVFISYELRPLLKPSKVFSGWHAVRVSS